MEAADGIWFYEYIRMHIYTSVCTCIHTNFNFTVISRFIQIDMLLVFKKITKEE